jgi:hypothetical protein
MEDQRGMQQHAHMERQHQRQLDIHMGPQHPRMERAHPIEPPARMLPGSASALPFPPGMGDLLKQRLDMGAAGTFLPVRLFLHMVYQRLSSAF